MRRLPLAISLCALAASLYALWTVQYQASPPRSADHVGLTEASPPASPAESPRRLDRTTTAADAARAVLYEEDPNDPVGKQFSGSVVWGTQANSAGGGAPPELAVRADIAIPGRKLAVTWTLRRVSEDGASTSHTVDITFKLPPDSPSGDIVNVPGVWMKEGEQGKGTALAAQSVKVTTGYFLIGLSGAPADQQRNLPLLKERSWFDIPVVYTNSLRAILAVEKGTAGKRAFAEAFEVWESTAKP